MLVSKVVLQEDQVSIYGRYSDEPDQLLDTKQVSDFGSELEWHDYVLAKVCESLHDNKLCRMGGNSK